MPRRISRGPLGRLLSEPFWWLITRSPAGGGRARGALIVWLWWERVYVWRHHVKALRDRGVFRIELRHYRGAPHRFEDGDEVHSGDLIAELHLVNDVAAADAGSEEWNPFHELTKARADLDALARLVASGSLGSVTAVHAVALVAPALARLGFEVKPLVPTNGTRLLRFYLIGLLAIYHPDGWRAAGRARARAWPSEAWMSTRTLVRSSRGMRPRS